MSESYLLTGAPIRGGDLVEIFYPDDGTIYLVVGHWFFEGPSWCDRHYHGVRILTSEGVVIAFNQHMIRNVS